MTLMFKFISGKYKGGEFPLDKNMIVVGRHSELDMVLSEDMVSRKHARILVSGDNIILEDMGSTNGTFVNGSRIKKVKLKLHDRILIGSSIAKLVDSSDTGQNMEDAAKIHGSTNAVSGSIEDIPIPEVLQLLVTSKKTGVLKVTMGTISAEIYLIQGIFKDVQMLNNDLEPKKILFKLIKLESGHFEFEQKDPSGFNERLNITLDAFLLEAAKYEDEVGLDDIELEDIDDDLDLDDFDEIDDASDDMFDLDDLEDEGSADIFDLDDLEEEPKETPKNDVFNFDDLDEEDSNGVFDLDDLEDKQETSLNEPKNKTTDDFDLDDLDDDDDFSLDDLDDEPKKQEETPKKEDDFNLDDLDDGDDFDLDDLDDEPKKQEETPKKEDDFNLDDLDDDDDDDDFSLDDLDDDNNNDFDLDDEPKKQEETPKKEDDFSFDDLDDDANDDFSLDDLDDDNNDFDLDDLDDKPKKQEETLKKEDDFGLDDLDDDNNDFDLDDLDDEPKKQEETPKKEDDFSFDDLDDHDNDDFSLDDLDDESKKQEETPIEKDIVLEDEIKDDTPVINLEELKEKFPSEGMFTLPLPLFSPLDELTKEQLKVLQLVHNFGVVSDIIENTELSLENTYSILDFLLEEDYIEQ